MFALCAVAAERVLGLKMFDVQLEGALALAAGEIAEMQTGEGKTLAAVPAVVWYAREGAGVHVMTVNDYLARRDAQWMGGIYEFLGLSVGHIQQGIGDGRSPPGLCLRHHLRHRQRDRLRSTARRPGAYAHASECTVRSQPP